MSNNKIEHFKINGRWPKLASRGNKAINTYIKNYFLKKAFRNVGKNIKGNINGKQKLTNYNEEKKE